MDRRKVLLLVAAVIAALGTTLVYLYVHNADSRADQRYGAVKVLKVVKQINQGETVEAAQEAGKIESAAVSQQDVLAGAINGIDPIAGKAATTTLYPGEQITTAKFAKDTSSTDLKIAKGKIAISIQMGDPQRVAAFLVPGDKVAVFVNCDKGTRLLLPSVDVAAAGSTTTAQSQSQAAQAADPAAATGEVLPKALLTLGVSQLEAEKVMYASRTCEPAFGLLTKDSQVAMSPGVNNSNLFN